MAHCAGRGVRVAIGLRRTRWRGVKRLQARKNGGACTGFPPCAWLRDGERETEILLRARLRAAAFGFRLVTVGRFCSAKGRFLPESSRASANHAALPASDARSPEVPQQYTGELLSLRC